MTPADRLVIVLLGTATLHIALGVGLAVVDGPGAPKKAPQLEVVEIEPPPPPPPPPPPVVTPVPEPIQPPPIAEPEPVKTPRAQPRVTRPAPVQPPAVTPPSDAPVDPNAGGTPVIKFDNVASGGKGPPVATGKRTVGRVGKGGKGGGTGTGEGTGAASGAPPAPVSVAVLKTRAKPKGNQDYINLEQDYPADALALGLEGQIKVRLTISAEGKVLKKQILTRLGHGLDELALRYADKLEFEPARDTDDRAVVSTEVWTFTFTLPK
jgi:protein TonB